MITIEGRRHFPLDQLAIAPTIRTLPKTPEAEAGVRGRGKEKERWAGMGKFDRLSV